MEAIRYKVYELTDGGTLQVPTEMDYGHRSPVYSSCGYETAEEAAAEIAKNRGYNLLILAIVEPQGHWG